MLVHNDITKQNDLLVIDVDPFSDGFYVTSELKTLGIRTRTGYTTDTLYKYLDMYFKALSYAKENYKSVTFNVPLFPCVTRGIDTAQDYLAKNLIPQIRFLLEEWPRV